MLELAVALAGSYREERLQALASGADVFRRHRDLPERLRGAIATATDALKLLPPHHAFRLLLSSGRHPLLPDEPNLVRVIGRLGMNTEDVLLPLGDVLTALQRAALYLSHHGRATLRRVGSPGRVCPLRTHCPHTKGAAA
jgi:hypothetical protein